MLNVMIVDDEPLVRLALHRMIAWQELGMRIVGEAGDGAEALEALRESEPVDILLADIQMPVMNGIELLRELRAEGARTGRRMPVPVMLSAYSDYKYVREAFVLGALDYVVKADMDAEHIVPVLLKAAATVERQEDGGSGSESAAEPAKGENGTEGAGCDEPALCAYLSQEQSGLDETGVLSLLAAKPGETNQICAVIRLAKATGTGDDIHGSIRQTIRTVLDSLGIEAQTCRMAAEEYALLTAFPQLRSATAIREKIHAALVLIQTRLAQYVNIRIAVGISGVDSGVREWPKLFRQARKLAERSYFDGFGKLIYPEALIGPVAQESMPFAARHRALADIRRTLVQAAGEPDEQAWRSPFEQLRKWLEGLTHAAAASEIQSALVDLLWELGGLLYPKGLRWDELQEGFNNPLEEVGKFDTLDETLRWLEHLLQGLHEELHGRNRVVRQPHSAPVAKAKAFIDAHFREDVNLTLISELVGVTESYLSKQFAKEVGCNFIGYVTKLRIEESKRLMQKGVKITEAAEKVGYMNPEHFSRIFKKTTGLSPKAFRDSLLQAYANG